MKRFIAILFFICLSFAVGYISKVIQEPSMVEWYPSLGKSSLTPPGMVFAIVWAVLYLLMGISAGIIWNMRSIYTWLVLLVFFIQLGLNLLWSVTFFGMQAPFMGVLVLTLLIVSVVLYMGIAYMQSKAAAYINIPYLLWLFFALYLNGYVAYFN